MLKSSFILLLLGLLVIAGYCLYRYAVDAQPLRGLAQIQTSNQPVLVSVARPSLFFVPDRNMQLQNWGLRTIRPENRRNQTASASVWFATYTNTKQALLVTALLETEEHWEWETGQHCPYPTLRSTSESLPNQTRYNSLFILKADANPFSAVSDFASDYALVYRTKLLLFLKKMQVIIEYQENLPKDLVPLVDLDSIYLKEFVQRARASSDLVVSNKNELQSEIVGTIQKISSANQTVSRRKLAKWSGEIQYSGFGK